MSRYGKKYFGRGKGVVANTLVCNHVPLNMRLIGPHCHESHYLFDLCYNNTTEINPDVISTDTEGVNQLNTLFLKTIDKRFAPRYKNFKERIQNLMSFQHHDKFKDLIIKPSRTFNLNLVKSEYDNILHIFASLLTGHMNQSYIVKKLNSINLKNNTKNALWEMNAILESHWLIDIIEDQSLRQASHGALCQGESYHSLFRAIRKTAGEALKGATELELMISAECTRLVANCVIFFNAIILNHLKSEADKNNNIELSKNIEKSSPIAFAHINFHGKYTFLDEMLFFSINEFLNSLKID